MLFNEEDSDIMECDICHLEVDNIVSHCEECHPEEFKSLMDKGLVQTIYENGKSTYQLSPWGEIVADHLVADPQKSN